MDESVRGVCVIEMAPATFYSTFLCYLFVIRLFWFPMLWELQHLF